MKPENIKILLILSIFTKGSTLAATGSTQIEPAGVIGAMGIAPYSPSEETTMKLTIAVLLISTLPAMAFAQPSTVFCHESHGEIIGDQCRLE